MIFLLWWAEKSFYDGDSIICRWMSCQLGENKYLGFPFQKLGSIKGREGVIFLSQDGETVEQWVRRRCKILVGTMDAPGQIWSMDGWDDGGVNRNVIWEMADKQ